MNSSAVSLDVFEASASYGAHLVLDRVSLSAAGGEFIALLGASGCGKTTLLRAICGFVALSGGSIAVGGRDITRLPPDKRNIAMVFQSYALWPHMTVGQNMGYGLKLRGVGRAQIIQLNAAGFDAVKHGALPLIADARAGLDALDHTLAAWTAPAEWTAKARALVADWNTAVTRATAPSNAALPSDAQVLGAVNRAAGPTDMVVCAAGGLPGELHKLWRVRETGTYHVEYGYSCMGYEIAGGLGVKLATPEREVWVLVGDGSYLMMNSEIATSVLLAKKLIIVVLDNGGFGCIDRLQRSCGAASFNNLFATGSGVDFAAHAASLGATSRKVTDLVELDAALAEARAAPRTSVVVIATDPAAGTAAGGAWWEVPVPEVSSKVEVAAARAAYDAARNRQRIGS